MYKARNFKGALLTSALSLIVTWSGQAYTVGYDLPEGNALPPAHEKLTAEAWQLLYDLAPGSVCGFKYLEKFADGEAAGRTFSYDHSTLDCHGRHDWQRHFFQYPGNPIRSVLIGTRIPDLQEMRAIDADNRSVHKKVLGIPIIDEHPSSSVDFSTGGQFPFQHFQMQAQRQMFGSDQELALRVMRDYIRESFLELVMLGSREGSTLRFGQETEVANSVSFENDYHGSLEGYIDGDMCTPNDSNDPVEVTTTHWPGVALGIVLHTIQDSFAHTLRYFSRSCETTANCELAIGAILNKKWTERGRLFGYSHGSPTCFQDDYPWPDVRYSDDDPVCVLASYPRNNDEARYYTGRGNWHDNAPYGFARDSSFFSASWDPRPSLPFDFHANRHRFTKKEAPSLREGALRHVGPDQVSALTVYATAEFLEALNLAICDQSQAAGAHTQALIDSYLDKWFSAEFELPEHGLGPSAKVSYRVDNGERLSAKEYRDLPWHNFRMVDLWPEESGLSAAPEAACPPWLRGDQDCVSRRFAIKHRESFAVKENPSAELFNAAPNTFYLFPSWTNKKEIPNQPFRRILDAEDFAPDRHTPGWYAKRSFEERIVQLSWFGGLRLIGPDERGQWRPHDLRKLGRTFAFAFLPGGYEMCVYDPGAGVKEYRGSAKRFDTSKNRCFYGGMEGKVVDLYGAIPGRAVVTLRPVDPDLDGVFSPAAGGAPGYVHGDNCPTTPNPGQDHGRIGSTWFTYGNACKPDVLIRCMKDDASNGTATRSYTITRDEPFVVERRNTACDHLDLVYADGSDRRVTAATITRQAYHEESKTWRRWQTYQGKIPSIGSQVDDFGYWPLIFPGGSGVSTTVSWRDVWPRSYWLVADNLSAAYTKRRSMIELRFDDGSRKTIELAPPRT